MPCLWHLNRRSVSAAFAIGLFCMWLPIPFQSLLAALLAVVFRANLPLSVVLVFITNPITMPPMLYFAYELGAAIVGKPPNDFNFHASLDWLMNGLVLIWKPFLLGIFLMAIISSIAGYYGIHLLWRMHVLQHWKNRRERRLQARQHKTTQPKQQTKAPYDPDQPEE